MGPRDARQHEGAPRSPVVPSGTATSTGSAHLLPHGQHGCGPLHLQDGFIQGDSYYNTITDILPSGVSQEGAPVGSSRSGSSERVAGCNVEEYHHVSGVVPHGRLLLRSGRPVWRNGIGPLCIVGDSSSVSFHHKNDDKSGGRSRSSEVEMEQVELRIPVSFPHSGSPVRGVQSPVVLLRLSPVRSTNVESTTVVCDPL